MRQQIDNGFAEEMIASALHPRHFARNLIQYGYDICLNEYVECDYKTILNVKQYVI
jgi:hypothetical protein